MNSTTSDPAPRDDAAHRVRRKRLVLLLLALGAAGGLYALLAAAGLRIPCLFHRLTGLYCPGCGVTRMCLSLLAGDWHAAFEANPVLLLSLPFFLILAIFAARRYLKTGDIRLPRPLRVMVYLLITVLLALGIARNLPLA